MLLRVYAVLISASFIVEIIMELTTAILFIVIIILFALPDVISSYLKCELTKQREQFIAILKESERLQINDLVAIKKALK